VPKLLKLFRNADPDEIKKHLFVVFYVIAFTFTLFQFIGLVRTLLDAILVGIYAFLFLSALTVYLVVHLRRYYKNVRSEEKGDV
jgi:cation transporter-like permease